MSGSADGNEAHPGTLAYRIYGQELVRERRKSGYFARNFLSLFEINPKTTNTMDAEKQEFDPRDLNQDGKVSIKEQLIDAANKGGEMLSKAADAVKEETEKVIGKVKDYKELTPEEKKAKQDEWNVKVTDAATKASDAISGVVEDVKEGALKLFKKNEAPSEYDC